MSIPIMKPYAMWQKVSAKLLVDTTGYMHR